MLVMAETGRAVDMPVSPRLSLINSVGAPLEIVVDSAETIEERGFHLMIGLTMQLLHCISIIFTAGELQ